MLVAVYCNPDKLLRLQVPLNASNDIGRIDQLFQYDNESYCFWLVQQQYSKTTLYIRLKLVSLTGHEKEAEKLRLDKISDIFRIYLSISKESSSKFAYGR